MAFFEEVDKMGLIERHIRRVTGLEMEQARNMLKEYGLARKELLDRLATVGSGTFTEAQLNSVITQLELGIEALNAQLDGETALGSDLLSEQSAEDAVKEMNRFEKEFSGVSLNIPVDAVLSSLDQGNLLLNRYRSSIETYNEGLRDNVQRELTQAVIQRTSYLQAVQKVGELFPHLRSPIAWQVQRIVRTELHGVYNVSKMGSLEKIRDDYAPDLKKALIHPMDARTAKDSKALAALNPIVDIDKPFRFKWRGVERVFMSPPDRPNDRSILVPYRQDWEEAA